MLVMLLLIALPPPSNRVTSHDPCATPFASPPPSAAGIKLLDVTTPTEDLHTKLFSHRAEGDDKRAVHDLASLLDRMLTLDPARRISVKEALQHPFVRPSTGAGHKAVGHKAHTGCEPTTAAAGAGGAGAASSAAVAAAASFSS